MRGFDTTQSSQSLVATKSKRSEAAKDRNSRPCANCQANRQKCKYDGGTSCERCSQTNKKCLPGKPNLRRKDLHEAHTTFINESGIKKPRRQRASAPTSNVSTRQDVVKKEKSIEDKREQQSQSSASSSLDAAKVVRPDTDALSLDLAQSTISTSRHSHSSPELFAPSYRSIPTATDEISDSNRIRSCMSTQTNETSIAYEPEYCDPNAGYEIPISSTSRHEMTLSITIPSNGQQDETITPPQHHAHENLEPSYEVLWIISSRIRYLIRPRNYIPPANMEFSPSASSAENPISATSLMSSIMFASPSSSTLSPWSTLAHEDTLNYEVGRYDNESYAGIPQSSPTPTFEYGQSLGQLPSGQVAMLNTVYATLIEHDLYQYIPLPFPIIERGPNEGLGEALMTPGDEEELPVESSFLT